MSQPDQPPSICSHCGASSPADAFVCSSCQKPLRTTDDELNPYAPPKALESRGVSPTLGATVLIGLAALVCGGVAIADPYSGIVVAVWVVPSVVRTLIVMGRKRAAGRPLSVPEMVVSVVGSLMLMVLVLVAAAIAFAVICTPIGLFSGALTQGSDTGVFVFAIVAGGIAGVATITYLLSRSLPSDKKEGKP